MPREPGQRKPQTPNPADPYTLNVRVPDSLPGFVETPLNSIPHTPNPSTPNPQKPELRALAGRQVGVPVSSP